MTKRSPIWASIAATVVLGLALTGCASGAAAEVEESAAEGATLRYGHVFTGQEYPSDIVGWGLYRGIIDEALADAGIAHVEPIGVGVGPDLNDALNSDSIDVVSYGDTPGLVAKAAGTPTRLLGFSTVDGRTIIVSTPDGPQTPEELEGKKIATVIGSVMHRSAADFLAEEGITVEFVSGGADAIALLESGSVDAIASWPYTPPLQALQRDEGYPLVWDSDDYDDYSYSGVFVAPEKIVDAYPKLPAAWREAISLSLDDALANKDEFYRWYSDLTGLDVALAPDFYELSRVATSTDDEVSEGQKILERAQKSLLVSGAILSEVDVNEWWVD